MKDDQPKTMFDVAVEVIPLSEPLKNWMRSHPEFIANLKFAYEDRFIPLGAALTSHPRDYLQDEVIGFIVYDMKVGKFKQDYIVNLGGTNTEFVLYSKAPGSQDHKNVHHIKSFFNKYDHDGSYERAHWLTLVQIDEMAKGKPFLAEMAHRTVAMVERGIEKPTQERIDEAYKAIIEHKRSQESDRRE
jgi:hypothetical protein